LLFTTKMLASTVKFSKCGRVRVTCSPVKELVSRPLEGVACATEPSGPNSVLEPPSSRRDFPLPRGLY
jgi:hypothetical protein